MANKKKAKPARTKRRQAYTTEQYSIEKLHEEREYGLFWYSWLWKLVRPVLIFLCSILIVVGLVTTGYNRIYNALFAPADRLNASIVEFKIESGDSVSEIGETLEEMKLLRNKSVFKYMIQFEGLTNSLSYGTYKLSPSMSVSEIISELTSGSQTNERVITIVPGWTCEDIANYLVAIGALTDTKEFLTLCDSPEQFVKASYALSAAQESGTLADRKYALEGYLAPDTYRIFLSATPESIINTLLAQGNKVVDDVFYADNRDFYTDEEGVYHEVETYQSDLTMDQSFILASMIEKEAGNEIDFARVSAVFHNRLKMGWKLDSDPTATYLTGAKHLILTESELNSANNYNTYYVNGLPIGPICNPSNAALTAALYPDLEYIRDGYLFFCATEPGSGMLAYAKTKEEHEANIAKYRPLWEAYDSQHATNG